MSSTSSFMRGKLRRFGGLILFYIFLSPGASAQVTVSGNVTFTGPLIPKNIENVKYVDPSNSKGWAGSDLAGWIASAFASCTNSVCTVWVSNGSYATSSASITVGVSPCVNYPSTQAQTLIPDTQVRWWVSHRQWIQSSLPP